ncbi:glycosyltransferase family 2 protein [Lacinutrix chionoecetis]
MFILLHNGTTVTSILDEVLQPANAFPVNLSITKTIQKIALKHPEELIVWCHVELIDNLNVKEFSKIFHHQRILASFNPTDTDYLPKEIGCVERSFYLKVNKNVTFPTWLMSSLVGGIYANVLNVIEPHLNYKANFDYFLLSLAKRAMVEGLFCYSEPRLLTNNKGINIKTPKATKQELFKFVKQHYKWVWVIFLAWCYAIYQGKSSVLSIIKSFFYKQLHSDFSLGTIEIKSSKKQIGDKSIDVIIPTIGRKKYLYDVLKDLAKQTHLPKNVIIVEQNPQPDSVSELHYLENESWPFNVKHEFTHQPGVCNARNMALAKVESEWTFLGDDDNRFNETLIENIFDRIEALGVNVATTVYLQKHEKQTYLNTAQTSIFGAGNSILKSSLLKNVSFNTNFEFNYGEDTEFGMQLRWIGEDVIYLADLKILHLKAPIGGYRIKIKQPWHDEAIQPKPSPTIQLLYQTYYTKQQLEGYKLLLFLKQFKAFGYKKPIKFKKKFAQQWQQSVLWSNKLKQNKNA